LGRDQIIIDGDDIHGDGVNIAGRRLPAVYEFDFLAPDGGLMSYAPDGRQAAAARNRWLNRATLAPGAALCRETEDLTVAELPQSRAKYCRAEYWLPDRFALAIA